MRRFRHVIIGGMILVLGSMELSAQETPPVSPPTPPPAQQTPPSTREVPTQDLPNQTPPEKTGDPVASSDVKVPDDIRLAMEELNNALGSRSGRRIAQKFSFEAMFESLTERKLIPPMDESKQAEVRDGLAAGMRAKFRSFGELAWNDVKWIRFEQVDEQRVSLLGRHYDADELSTCVHWWLKREGVHWKVYDLEILDMNMRFSALVGAGFSLAGRSLKSVNNFQELASSAELLNSGMLDEEDLEDLIENADAVIDDEVPADLKRFALFLRAIALVQLDEASSALEDLATLEKMPSNSPILYRLRGEILVSQERFEAAIESFKKLGEQLGYDVSVYESISDAYLALGKYEAAAEHARLGLKDKPESVGCLASLAAALPPAKVAELEPFFKDHEYDEDVLATVIVWCLDSDRLAGAKYAFQALKKHHPKSDLIEAFSEDLDSADDQVQ
jgi:tetratricopeptide (TPR) repeat protein